MQAISIVSSALLTKASITHQPSKTVLDAALRRVLEKKPALDITMRHGSISPFQNQDLSSRKISYSVLQLPAPPTPD
jgi:hypothetical protein